MNSARVSGGKVSSPITNFHSVGQSVWFQKYHPEKFPSAIERYQKEALRVVKVRDTYLRENKKEYLVGDKCTYADIAFVPWDDLVFPMVSGFQGDPAKVSFYLASSLLCFET